MTAPVKGHCERCTAWTQLSLEPGGQLICDACWESAYGPRHPDTGPVIPAWIVDAQRGRALCAQCLDSPCKCHRGDHYLRIYQEGGPR